MATLPPVPNVVQANLLFYVGNDIEAMVRTFIAYTGSAPTSAAATALAADVQGQMAAHFPAIMPGTWGSRGCEITDLSSPTGGQGEHLANVAGTHAGNANPPSAALVYNLQIGRRYRGGKPRNFWPFGVNGDIDASGQWDATNIAVYTTALNAFWTAVNGQTSGGCVLGGQVNVSYYLGYTNQAYGTPTKYRRIPTLRAVPVVDPVVSRSASLIVGSVRRRNKDA